MPSAAKFTRTLRNDVLGVADYLGHEINSPMGYDQPLLDYALLVFATSTPIDRALTYLKDTGSPVHATGRLLLRAAERALRANGDMPEAAYGAEAELRQ